MKRFLLIFIVLLGTANLKAQTLYVTSGGSVVAQNTPVNIAGNATVTSGSTSLVGATVSISSNFASGQDVLGLNGAASGGISSSYNATTGVLTLGGAATAVDYQATLQKVTYTNTSATPIKTARVITLSLNSALPFTGNGHYYEFVTSGGISWTAANTAANSRNYFGLQGYLVTVMSAEENAFCAAKLVGDGWMGANAAADGITWKWMSGPEAGTVFWNGVSYGSAVSGKYANWADSQPDGSAHTEDYVQFYSSGGLGKWNNLPEDYDPLINGYVVEYGGTTGDPVLHISDNVVVGFAPEVSDLTTTSGSNIKWYAASTGGSPLATSTLLVNGTTYYASQTVNGVESATRLAVTATVSTTTPGTPGAISGETNPFEYTTQTYSIATVVGATSYNWTAVGMTILSGQGTNSISVNVGSSVSRSITVNATNACGTSIANSVAVFPIPNLVVE